jgi:hypothetical protein
VAGSSGRSITGAGGTVATAPEGWASNEPTEEKISKATPGATTCNRQNLGFITLSLTRIAPICFLPREGARAGGRSSFRSIRKNFPSPVRPPGSGVNGGAPARRSFCEGRSPRSFGTKLIPRRPPLLHDSLPPRRRFRRRRPGRRAPATSSHFRSSPKLS